MIYQKYFYVKKIFLTAISFAAGLSALSCANAQQPVPQENIALGKGATYSEDPNFRLTWSKDNNAKITDGKYFDGDNVLWTSKSTVGWETTWDKKTKEVATRSSVSITIDLGEVQPISGVSYSTAAGINSVIWPKFIYIATSEDNNNWHLAGNLVSLSRQRGDSPKGGYNAFRYITHELQTKGRYIRFTIVGSPFVFVDEIEVYKGKTEFLNQPPQGALITDATTAQWDKLAKHPDKRRMVADIDEVREKLQKSTISASQKTTFEARLTHNQNAALDLPPLTVEKKAIIPLNDTDRDTFAVYGEVLKAEGYKPLTIWKKHRYAFLPLFEMPEKSATPGINFSMLGNQYRNDSLLLTNATGAAASVTLQLENPPKGATAGWLSVDSVDWIDTAQEIAVPSPLIPISAENGQYKIDIPAGMTRKVWFTVDSSKVPAGSYKSTFAVSGLGNNTTVPFSLDVASVAMPTPEFSTGVWDYTEGGKGNNDGLISLMRSHYVNAPWARRRILPWPNGTFFDKNNNLIKPLDFTKFDEWIADWKGARYYMVHAEIAWVKNTEFGGATLGTPEFDARLAAWAKAVAEHMKSKGLKPSQLGLLLIDEPKSEDSARYTAGWAKAIKAGADITIFIDPLYKDPSKVKEQGIFTSADIISPLRKNTTGDNNLSLKYYQDLAKNDKDLWIYNLEWSVHTMSPSTYYRIQPWEVFKIGGVGQGFWSVTDKRRKNSWNPYYLSVYGATNIGQNYSPLYIDENGVATNSIHWDAVREGVEDFEELTMLKHAIQKSQDAAWKAKAQKVLDDAVAAVTKISGNYRWHVENDPAVVDAQLANVRQMISGEAK